MSATEPAEYPRSHGTEMENHPGSGQRPGLFVLFKTITELPKKRPLETVKSPLSELADPGDIRPGDYPDSQSYVTDASGMDIDWLSQNFD